MLADTTAYDVLIALFASIPATVAAVFAGVVALRTRTSNGRTLGGMIEDTRATSIENNTMLRGSTSIPDESKP